MTKFKVVGKIRGKARPRFSSKTGSVYKVRADRKDEVNISEAYRDAGGEYYEGYIRATINMYFKCNKSDSKKVKAQKLAGLLKPAKKPDCDNTAKLVLDSLNNVAYKDDIQVIELICRKYYTNEEEDYLEVIIEEIKEEVLVC